LHLTFESFDDTFSISDLLAELTPLATVVAPLTIYLEILVATLLMLGIKEIVSSPDGSNSTIERFLFLREYGSRSISFLAA
jgi:hypothetical protein